MAQTLTPDTPLQVAQTLTPNTPLQVAQTLTSDMLLQVAQTPTPNTPLQVAQTPTPYTPLQVAQTLTPDMPLQVAECELKGVVKLARLASISNMHAKSVSSMHRHEADVPNSPWQLLRQGTSLAGSGTAGSSSPAAFSCATSFVGFLMKRPGSVTRLGSYSAVHPLPQMRVSEQGQELGGGGGGDGQGCDVAGPSHPVSQQAEGEDPESADQVVRNLLLRLGPLALQGGRRPSEGTTRRSSVISSGGPGDSFMRRPSQTAGGPLSFIRWPSQTEAGRPSPFWPPLQAEGGQASPCRWPSEPGGVRRSPLSVGGLSSHVSLRPALRANRSFCVSSREGGPLAGLGSSEPPRGEGEPCVGGEAASRWAYKVTPADRARPASSGPLSHLVLSCSHLIQRTASDSGSGGADGGSPLQRTASAAATDSHSLQWSAGDGGGGGSPLQRTASASTATDSRRLQGHSVSFRPLDLQDPTGDAPPHAATAPNTTTPSHSIIRRACTASFNLAQPPTYLERGMAYLGDLQGGAAYLGAKLGSPSRMEASPNDDTDLDRDPDHVMP